MVKQFLKFYTAESPRWDNMTDLASSLGWTELVSRSTADFFESQHIGKNYVREIVEASTRVNYGQVCPLLPTDFSEVHVGIEC